jgi:hypothetical protein
MKTVLPVKIEPHSFRNRDIIGGDAALDRARVRCLLSERPHQWEHEQNCQNADKYLFWFHDAIATLMLTHYFRKFCAVLQKKCK